MKMLHAEIKTTSSKALLRDMVVIKCISFPGRAGDASRGAFFFEGPIEIVVQLGRSCPPRGLPLGAYSCAHPMARWTRTPSRPCWVRTMEGSWDCDFEVVTKAKSVRPLAERMACRDWRGRAKSGGDFTNAYHLIALDNMNACYAFLQVKGLF